MTGYTRGTARAILQADSHDVLSGGGEPQDPAAAEPRLGQAVRNFAETWRELLTGALADDYGCTLTCAEAETAAGVYRALGDERTAAAVVAAHARHDDEGDEHFGQGGSDE